MSCVSDVPDVLSALGARIRGERQRLGLSQEAFADKCGFDRTYISLVERGKRNISFLNLCTIAAGLGVSISNLTQGIEHGTNTN